MLVESNPQIQRKEVFCISNKGFNQRDAYRVMLRNDDTIVGVIRGRRIVAVIYGNKADFLHGKVTLNVVAGVYDISTQAGEVFYNDAVDKPLFNIGEHLLEARSVE